MPIHTSWKSMLQGMKGTYCKKGAKLDQSMKFTDGSTVKVCSKASSVFYGTVKTMGADYKSARPKKKVQEAVEKTPAFIRIRVEDPKKFIRFRIKVLGKGIKAVIGFLKKGGSRIQSILFPRSKFTLSQAKAWAKRHGYPVSETYWVHDILIDPDTIELYFEETVAQDENEVPEVDVVKVTKDQFAWLIEDE